MKTRPLFSAARLFSVPRAISFCLLLINLINGSASAAEVSPDTSLKAPQFNYAGFKNDLLAFSVHYLNPDGKRFLLEVKDENSDVLYEHTFDGKDFEKTIYLLNTRDKTTISFQIRAGKSMFKETFQINPEIKVVEDLVVRRL